MHGGGSGDPYGATFQPPSCDAVLREHYWFWEPNTESSIKSTRKLVDNYLTSVGKRTHAHTTLNLTGSEIFTKHALYFLFSFLLSLSLLFFIFIKKTANFNGNTVEYVHI